MESKKETRGTRKVYEAPKVTRSVAFETLAMSCGKQTPDVPRTEICNMGPLVSS